MTPDTVYIDSEGREWLMKVTVSVLERCRDQGGYDPMALVVGGEMYKSVTNPVLMTTLAWFTVEEDAKKRGITQQQFRDAAHGEALDHLRNAWIAAFTRFFPKAQGEPIRLAAQECMSQYLGLLNKLRMHGGSESGSQQE